MNADSVKARLKNFAVKNGCTFQEALTYYGLERTIYRISVSKYAEQFVLKGGIFLYAVFDRRYERATTDVDLLARRISNSGEEMKNVFREILSLDIDDSLVFETDSITVEDITEFKEYHGLHIPEKEKGTYTGMNGVTSDLTITPRVMAAQGSYSGSAASSGDLISGINTALNTALAGGGAAGDIVIPVYIGGDMIDEIVVTAQQRMNLRSGGR